MTNLSTIQLKAIQAIIENIDVEDDEDAATAVLDLIRKLIEPRAK